MTDDILQEKLEAIYASLANDNENIDALILELKIVLHARGTKTVEVEASKLVQPNRQGRKMMQSYFKKRGVEVTFAGAKD